MENKKQDARVKIIKPYVEVVQPDVDHILRKLEWAGRKCYQSEGLIKEGSAYKFISGIVKRGHESVIEHDVITVNFVVDRGTSHEIVRHRIAAYSQESTRYCTYSSDKFGSTITYIEPFFYSPGTPEYDEWYDSCVYTATKYNNLVKLGSSKLGGAAEKARSVLLHSVKTEVVTTYNIREWRHFLKLRTHASAHPQIRQVAIPLLLLFQHLLPALFSDIDTWDKSFPEAHYADIMFKDFILGDLTPTTT